MVMSPAASLPGPDNGSLIGEADLLPRHPVFRARDLEPAREYLSGVLAPHRLAYLTREHRLNFRHRRAKLGAVELNALQFGGDVMVTAPHIPDYFLLQFTLAGSCTLAQGGRTYVGGARGAQIGDGVLDVLGHFLLLSLGAARYLRTDFQDIVRERGGSSAAASVVSRFGTQRASAA